MPFEDFHALPDLKALADYILDSLQVSEVKVVVPGEFDPKLIDDPTVAVPVANIEVGNASFSYIRSRANHVLTNVKIRIDKINKDEQLSVADKLQIFREVNRRISIEHKYFNSMTPIRYMSMYEWKISYSEEIDGKTVQRERNYPNSQIDLLEGHWTIIENTFVIRRDLISEIRYLIEVELDKLEDNLANTKYIWQGTEPYELHELIIAIVASDRVKYQKGDENTFVHDILALFGITDNNFALSKSKVLKRVTRSRFLAVLEESLENRGRKKHKDNS
jgi:hypothetical protein